MNILLIKKFRTKKNNIAKKKKLHTFWAFKYIEIKSSVVVCPFFCFVAEINIGYRKKKKQKKNQVILNTIISNILERFKMNGYNNIIPCVWYTDKIAEQK